LFAPQTAPDASWQQAVEECFKKAASGLTDDDYRIRLLKMGNTLNILVHVKPGPGFELTGLDQLDEIRFKFYSEPEALDVKTTADIVFVGDMQLAV